MSKIVIDKGFMNIDLDWLFAQLKQEEKLRLIETLSCEDAIIKHVTDQLLEGWTENSYHGYTGTDAAEPTTPLDKGRRRIALGAGAVAKEEIARLVRQLSRATQWQRAYCDWGFELEKQVYDLGGKPKAKPRL